MKRIKASYHVEESNEYFCKKCAKRYKATEIQIDVDKGRMLAWWCPKNHPVKLIGKTALPCPMCGATYKNYAGEAKPFREEGRPCDSCMSEYERMKKAVAALEKETAGMEIRAVPAWVSMPTPAFSEIELGHLFLKLVLLVGVPSASSKEYNTPKIPTPYHADGAGPVYEVRKYSPEQIDAIQKLYDGIVEVIRLTKEEGRSEGEQFITRLAAGEISVESMNKHALNNYHADKVQEVFELATSGRQLKKDEEWKLKREISSALQR